MVYLEYLRVRRVLVWFAVVFTPIALFIAVAGAIARDAHLTHHLTSGSLANSMTVPVDAIVGLGMLCALGFATSIASSLNRETSHAHFTWVRPLSRVRLAALIVAVDAAAVGAAGIFASLLFLLSVAISLGDFAHYVWRPDSLLAAALGLGCALLWYALLQASSAWSSGRGGGLVALAAIVLVLAIPLSHADFLGPVRYVFRAITFIDPFAYFASTTTHGTIASEIATSLWARVATVWLLALAALGAAALAWKRVQV